ncbi:hypothetical protein L5D93_00295 [Paenibacillus thiaminolyticus]|nr:hypothetical protein [Paenibacillus thiaminolyticus]
MAKGLRPHPESDAIDGIEYDRHYRMKYHPDFHFSHGKPFSRDDLEYLSMFYEVDDARTMAFALGKTEHVCRVKYASLKKAGLLEYYRNSYKNVWRRNVVREADPFFQDIPWDIIKNDSGDVVGAVYVLLRIRRRGGGRRSDGVYCAIEPNIYSRKWRG